MRESLCLHQLNLNLYEVYFKVLLGLYKISVVCPFMMSIIGILCCLLFGSKVLMQNSKKISDYTELQRIYIDIFTPTSWLLYTLQVNKQIHYMVTTI